MEPDSPNLLSQYDLEALGFTVIEDDPDSFDHLDGETPATGLVRAILVYLMQKAGNDLSFSHLLEVYDYQRLIDVIDAGVRFSSEEFRRAIHNNRYYKDLYKIIAYHPREWYYKSNDPIWTMFLDKLLPDAPSWKSYDEQVIDKLSWMQEIDIKDKDKDKDKDKISTLGPLLWHMHPIMFIDFFIKKSNIRYIYTKYKYTLLDMTNKQLSVPNKFGNELVPENKEREVVSHYMDPDNFSNKSKYNIFQFFIIKVYMRVPAESLRKFLSGKGSLSGQEESFIDAAKKYNLNECYLAAHSALETGNGRPTGMGGGRVFKGKKVYNMYGICASDNNQRIGALGTAYKKEWFSPDVAIIKGVEWISTHFINSKKHSQNTLYKMKWNPVYHEYATGVNWADEIARNMMQTCGFDFSFANHEIVFDIPEYEK